MALPASFSLFVEKIKEGLKRPLPGEMAHQEMEALSARWLGVKPNKQTRKSAVLILLYPCNGEVCLPLILRQSYDGVHSGQVAFPGGKYEHTDENLICTALREAQEEIGLNTNDVQILGTLSEIFISPSNFLVLPVIGSISYRPDMVPNPREVEQILEVNINHFKDPNILGKSEYLVLGKQVITPHYDVQGYKMWGATAKVIAELLSITMDSEIKT